MKNKHPREKFCGECIFCASKCPECGSNDIEVKFAVGFTYQNHIEDTIQIFQHIEKMEFQCDFCGEWIVEDEYMEDDRLDNLRQGIRKDFLGDETRFTHRDDGKIDVQRCILDSMKG